MKEFEVKYFEIGQDVLRAGEASLYFYIVKEGEVVCHSPVHPEEAMVSAVS